MSANHRSNSGGLARFLSGKGFYVVLAACLLGAGTAAWSAATRAIDQVQQENSGVVQELPQAEGEESQWVEEHQVGQAIPDLPKEESGSSEEPSSSSSSSSSPSSSEGSSEQPVQPVQSVQSEKPPVSVFVLPVEGQVLASYSDGQLTKNETLKVWRTHDGVDLAAQIGDPVVCAADGTVSRLYEDPLWGRTVEISHEGGLTSVYCGLGEAASLTEGQYLAAGTQVGTVGICPAEQLEEPHLHFAMKADGQWVDPLATMGKLPQ